ncbi:hypothetical protein BCR37DRAFT_391692 [Protomyces lactucae-debilis]|uniref:Uncharacterized protein n=1 Tax=Protomyces lactucae-debilis TaxID=2754530 RepID=A0A1Y2FQK4_PROLT|nr:uncharacterized protein BCR37DRAFT_391692 [Protomyces lactucae-debilis]ORY84975.1 hypothetical protein BCR37DRAFT_391692 [Protomyces lactucae-debilis]
MSTSSLNVLGKPLAYFGGPSFMKTGFFRDGYCRTSPQDYGQHAVAAIVTDEFLQFSAEAGNDLRTIGLTQDCKWCLCVSRWKQALDAYKAGDLSKAGVPRVVLDATEDSTLKKIQLEDLKAFSTGLKKDEL